jgi:hypothetical protein
MRWMIPASVVIAGLGVLMLYVPFGKGAALIIPPGAPVALVLAGTIGIVFGVARVWWSRRQIGEVASTGTRGRAADVAALAGLVVALAAVLAVSTVFVFEPILASLQGPDPCGPATFQPDTACFSAHPDYYRYDPVAGSWSTPGSRLSRTLDRVAGPAAVPLALVAALISWVAMTMGTRRRRTVLTALTLSSLAIALLVFLMFALIFGGGGE